MWRNISLHAYDVLDEVHVSLRISTADASSEAAPAAVEICSTTFAGKGEEDPRAWARDALVAMIEEL